jgi:hypothetical protein
LKGFDIEEVKIWCLSTAWVVQFVTSGPYDCDSYFENVEKRGGRGETFTITTKSNSDVLLVEKSSVIKNV